MCTWRGQSAPQNLGAWLANHPQLLQLGMLRHAVSQPPVCVQGMLTPHVASGAAHPVVPLQSAGCIAQALSNTCVEPSCSSDSYFGSRQREKALLA